MALAACITEQQHYQLLWFKETALKFPDKPQNTPVLRHWRVLYSIVTYFMYRGFDVTTHEKFTMKTIYQTKLRIEKMAKKAVPGKDSKIGTWNGIANVAFNSDDKDNYMVWKETIEIDDLLHQLIASDYKLTMSYDNRSDAFMCSLSCYNANETNFKFTMTSRAPNPTDAMLVALYKHFVISTENWGASTQEDTWS